MDTKFFSCYILGHTGSNYITVYLLFDGCDYFISQKQEEGKITRRTGPIKSLRKGVPSLGTLVTW